MSELQTRQSASKGGTLALKAFLFGSSGSFVGSGSFATYQGLSRRILITITQPHPRKLDLGDFWVDVKYSDYCYNPEGSYVLPLRN